VIVKSTIFWDITPCSPLSTDVSDEHIASIFRGEKINSDPEDGGDMFLRNVG
jgi:hypothetical protein